MRIDGSATARTRCTKCGKSWPPHTTTCPDDGASLRHEGIHEQPSEPFAESVVTEGRKPEAFSDNGDTTIDVADTNGGHRGGGGATAISPPFAGTPTSLAAVGPISSGEITAQDARAVESAPPPTAEPASNPDPTTSTKLEPGFVHLVPGTLVDVFEIEELLGAGGMGAVYGAHHEKLGRRVAIKVIAPNLSRDRDAIERFEQEAQALARLSHPNIVGVLAVGTLPGDGRSYFVMDFVRGASLQARLDRDGVSLEDALDLIDQIARGLEAAHAAGIIHRDLKPDNCWIHQVGDEGRPVVKLLDFGLSKLTQHRRSEETVVNTTFGTPQFMSPEQCQSARDVGPATDTYALGCIAYELLCGRLPFLHDNFAELIVAHQTEDPPRPRDLSPAIDHELDELVYSMLAKDPARRPTLSAVRSTIEHAQKRAAIRQWGAPSQQRTAPRGVAAPSSPPRRLRRALFGGAGVAVVALIAFAATLGARGQGDDHDDPGRAIAVQIDAGAAGSLVPPIDSGSAAAVVVHTPPIDGGATPRRTTEPTAPTTPEVTTSGRETAATPVDAAVADNADATSTTIVVIDAGQPEVSSPPPTSEKKPSDPAGRPATLHPDKSRPVDRDKTYNPFTRKPSVR